MQGTAADLIKLAMIERKHRLRTELRSRLITAVTTNWCWKPG